MKTDIEIARSGKMRRITEIAENIGIPEEKVEQYGHYMAKVPHSLINEEKISKSKLVLVTAISAPKAGIGKTTVSVGLALGLNKIGKKAGVKHVHPHKFRRTLATEMARHGMPIQEVASILGHEKLDTTMGYVVLDHDSVKANYRKYA